MRVSRASAVVLACVLFGTARPARADATAFLGIASNPSRPARGFAIGASIILIGFEFEYMKLSEDFEAQKPSLWTGMGNVSVQTPTRFQLYATTGVGLYRERLATIQETNIGLNTGFGAKVPLAGPIRARFDYRVFNLRGSPLHKSAQRFYAGVNLAF